MHSTKQWIHSENEKKKSQEQWTVMKNDSSVYKKMCNQERQSWDEKRNHQEWERWWTEARTRSEINDRKKNSDRYSQERWA